MLHRRVDVRKGTRKEGLTFITLYCSVQGIMWIQLVLLMRYLRTEETGVTGISNSIIT